MGTNLYLLDAGRSHTIATALQPVLAEIRALFGASVALVGYHPRNVGSDLLVLATDSPRMADLSLPNESFRVGRFASRRRSAVASNKRRLRR